MIMAQETRNVDYESMVEKYMNEWDGCNLREFCCRSLMMPMVVRPMSMTVVSIT